MERTGFPLLVVATALAALLSGCGSAQRAPAGGPSSGDSRGAVQLTIVWPQSRLIPTRAQSIRIVLSAGEETLRDTVVPRPAEGQDTSTVQFDQLPTRPIEILATAYPNADGTGVAQAAGAITVNVPAGTVSASLVMGSTITTVQVSPQAPSLDLAATLRLVATALDAAGRVVLTSSASWTWSSSNASVAKVYGAGSRAIVIGAAGGTATVTAVESESGQTASTVVTVGAAAPITFAAPVTYPATTPGRDLIAVDLDRDGRLDLVAAGGRRVTLLYGRGDGTFEPARYVAVGNALSQVVAADFDTDGRLDIAVCDAEGGNRVGVLRSTARRSFAAPVYYPVGIKPYGIDAGDFNGDQKPDLVTANDGTNDFGLLLNAGNGTFGAATFFGAGDDPVRVLSYDSNGDGKMDVAVSNNSSGDVILFLGDGAGRFTRGQRYEVGQYPGDILKADLNNDGKIDLATTNAFSHSVSVLTGAGNGTFTVSREYPANTYPRCMGAGDLDGDGWLDIVVPNSSPANHLSLLRNTGSGVLAAPVRLESGGLGASAVAIADFNRDGKPDVAAGNGDSDTVAVLLNTTDFRGQLDLVVR